MKSSASTRPKIKSKLHQLEALTASKGHAFFAYFMDPGTGKTHTLLKDAWRAYSAGDIDAVLVLSPNNVKDSWVKWDHMMENPDDEDQVTIHLRDHLSQIVKGVWINGATGQSKKCWAEYEDRLDHIQNKLVFLSVNYEALLGSQFFDFLMAFCEKFRVMIVADESTRIGKPGSKRTKAAIKLRKLCPERRILTGTPIVKSPLKIFSQAKFLDDKALPFKNFYGFRNHFCIMGGFQGKQVLGYKNLEELSSLIEKFSFRKRKSECLELPPQDFRKSRVYMTPEQTKAYKTMQEEFFVQIKDDEINARIVLAQMTRLQQITGGYIRTKDGRDLEIITPDRNPKLLDAFQKIIDAPGQTVVWARFRPELEGLRQLLEAHNKTNPAEKIRVAEFHGGVPEKDRGAIKAGFKRGQYDVILGTKSTGGIGINEFVVADTVIHISGDADTEARIQADDRTHRMGSEVHDKVTYWDVLVPNTVDVKVLAIMRGDTKISASILKDHWREWV